MFQTIIRQAKINDLKFIVQIYNEAILEGGFTADLKPYTLKEKELWFMNLNTLNYGIYVLSLNETVIAYFYFSPWRSGREALKSTAEISFYIKKEFRGKGLANLIMKNIHLLAKEKNFENLMTIMLDINIRSRKLLEKYGFKVVGHLPKIANLKNATCGQYIHMKNITRSTYPTSK